MTAYKIDYNSDFPKPDNFHSLLSFYCHLFVTICILKCVVMKEIINYF